MDGLLDPTKFRVKWESAATWQGSTGDFVYWMLWTGWLDGCAISVAGGVWSGSF